MTKKVIKKRIIINIIAFFGISAMYLQPGLKKLHNFNDMVLLEEVK